MLEPIGKLNNSLHRYSNGNHHLYLLIGRGIGLRNEPLGFDDVKDELSANISQRNYRGFSDTLQVNLEGSIWFP